MIPRSKALQILAGVLAVLALLVILGGVTLVAEGSGHIPGQGIAWGSALEREPVNVLASTCTVTSTANTGDGTLRACLEGAVVSDTITFHPAFFPPDNPATIGLESILPYITTDGLTIDASDAGVILDGNAIEDDGAGQSGLVIDGARGCVIRGLQIVNFPYYGVEIMGGDHNEIGGNRELGAGPMGQGNLISGNCYGLQIHGSTAVSNTVIGNFIGTNLDGDAAVGGRCGATNGMQVGSDHNQIGSTEQGERNIIAGYLWLAPPGAAPANNRIVGNHVGLDVSGTVTVCIGSGWSGISVWGLDNVIGGDTPAEGNRVCGYDHHGISISGSDNYVANNESFDNDEHGVKIGGSDNTIAHNEIHGNARAGIQIGGSGNTIAHNESFDNDEHGVQIGGSDNTIAQNEIHGNAGAGIQVASWEARPYYNRLTQNSIYDNGLLGIELWWPVSSRIKAPTVLAFNATEGTANGTACAGCTVEVFSDNGDEGRWFMTDTLAAATDGTWSIDTGDPFLGKYVHATATDAAGDTSEFSRPTHDVGVVRASPGGDVPLHQQSQVGAELRNTGSEWEGPVPVYCAIEDTDYDASGSCGSLWPSTWGRVGFPAWMPAAAGVYTLTCRSELPGDEYPENDAFTQVVTATGSPRDVWTRDNPEDTGDVPSGRSYWISPDTWVRYQDDGGTEHQNPVAFRENTVYVRLRNRGGRAASGVVRVFWMRMNAAWVCSGILPNVGTVSFQDLAPGEESIVSLPWRPPFAGCTCGYGLYTVIDAEGDPPEWSGCDPYRVRWDNNVSWLNVWRVYRNPPAGRQQAQAADEAQVYVVNPYDWPKDTDLIIERGTFPTTGTIALRLDETFFDRWLAYEGGWYENAEVNETTRVITSTGEVSTTIGGLPLEAEEEVTATLIFDAPYAGVFEVSLHERIHGLSVGGLSFQWILSDTVAPQVETTSPLGGAVDVPPDAAIVITFGEQIGPLTLELGLTPELDPGGWGMIWNSAGTVVTATHSGFALGETYTATVTAKDAFANPMEEPYTWSFTVSEAYYVYLPLVLRNH